MTSRERVAAALSHEESDRVPLDLGGSLVSSIALSSYEALRDALRLPKRPITVLAELDGVALVDNDVLDRMGLDVVPFFAGEPSDPWESWEDGEGSHIRDPFGTVLFKPKAGHAYDYVNVSLAGPTVTRADLDRIRWGALTDAGYYAGLREKARGLRDGTDRAIFSMAPNGHDLLNRWFRVRGMQEGLMDLLLNGEVAEEFFQRLADAICRSQELFLRQVGDLVDVHFLGDDFGSQNGLIVAPDYLRKVIFPLWARIIRCIKGHTRAKVFFHTCGAVEPVIPDLIEMGVDVLNPIQMTCAGMDTKELKRKYGRNISFWGGGIDTQSVLARGTVGDVRREVRRRVGDLSPGGGFVFTPVHNIQPGVPVENVIAAFDEARRQDHGA